MTRLAGERARGVRPSRVRRRRVTTRSTATRDTRRRSHRLDLRLRDHLRCHWGDELGVAGRAHLGDVEAGDLDLGGDAVAAEELADQLEGEAGDEEVPGEAGAA